MFNFENDYNKCENVIKVKISDEQKKKIDEFCDALQKEKMKEPEYKNDNGKFRDRAFTGKMGECSLENLFNKEYVDWEVGPTTKYAVPDLKPILGVNVGVKTVQYGNYPVVKKNSKYPEVICVLLNDSEVAVCGLATVDVLSKYTSDDLIKSPNLKVKGNKTGFYGFEHLKPFNDLNELKKLLSE